MEEETDHKWGRELTTNENLMKLIKLRKEYEPIYNSSKGFKKQGWEQISNELKIRKNANSCRKRFLDLTHKYRDIKEKLDSGYKKAECWPLFDIMKSILESEVVSFREDVKLEKEKRTYYKWENPSKVIELVERRRDYESIYRNSFGFSVTGWEKIAEDLKIGVCGTSCRKKFNLLLQNYRERSASSDIKEKKKIMKATDTDIFNGLLKMVSKNQKSFHAIEFKLGSNISIERTQFKWFDDRVIMLINLRKYYTGTYETLEGFAAAGWEQIAQEIGDGVTAESCRKKFVRLTEELENTTRNPDVAQSDGFYDQLINLILSDTNKHKMPNSSDYVCYESERAVESLSDCYKENIGSIEEYYEVFEEDGNQLKLSMVKDEIEIKEEIKRNRPNSMRQYFKWEANDNRNTHRMLELVGKYLKVYPDSKFKENKSLSSKIWTAIANDFNNEVTPGSIRKKFSTVVQLYKANQCEIESNPDARKNPFYDELNVIFEKSVIECHDGYEPSIEDEETESKISICEELIEEELDDVLDDVLEDENLFEIIKTEEDKSDTLKICTFCLRVFPGTSTAITLIYDESDKDSSHILIEKINKVLFENKTEKFDHEISNMSCAPCLENINACYSFKEQCLKSWNYVHEMKRSDQSNMELIRDEIDECQSNQVKEKKMKKKKQFPCPYECDKKFTKKTLLMKHIERHLVKKRIKPKLEYACPVTPCRQLFESDLSMRRHCIDVHSRFKPFSCHDCDATFFKKQSIDNHYIRKHQVKYQMEFIEEDI